MLFVLIDFFETISFGDAFLIALFCTLIIWAILWNVDAYTSKRVLENFSDLRYLIDDFLKHNHQGFAHKIGNSSFICTPSFKTALGIEITESIDVVLLSWLQKKYNYATWDEIRNHLQFENVPTLFHVTIDEKTTLQLYGRAFRNVLVFWTTSAKDEHSLMLKRIIDNIPLAVWYRDANNNIAYCNEVYAGALEHSKREIIDLSLELIPKDRPLGPYHLSVMAQDGYKMIKERDHAVLSGSRRLLEFGAIPFKNGETVNYASDLSEVEGLQNILEQLTKSHHEILHNLSTGVSVFGDDTRLLFYNHAYVKIFDFDEEWLATKPTLLEVLDDLRQRRKIPEYSNFQQMKKNRLKLFKTLLQPMYETTHQPSGQVLRMVIAPYLQGGLVYIFEDVSDRIALERQYNTLSAVQRETIDHLYEGIIVIGSDLRLRILNKAAINLLMIKEPEWFLGKNLNEIFFIPDSIFSEPRQEFFNQLMVLFEKRHPFQGTLTLKNHIIAQYSYLPLPDGAHLLSMVDITNAKRLETSLKERNNLLSEINLLKSHFIHHVVNELKAPLKSMQYLAEDLEQDDFSHDYCDKQRLYGQEINDMSQHLITMLDEMVTLSQIEAPHTDYAILEDITLDIFLKNMLGLIAWHAEEKSISVKLNNLCRVLTFKGDERRLKQIFFNILQNGVKGARQNSELHVNVAHEHLGNNHFLVFCVEILPSVTADHGQQDLFDRKIKPQMVDHSEDFGLSLASKFLEMQKGSLTIKQTPPLITLLAKLPIEQCTRFSDDSSKVA